MGGSRLSVVLLLSSLVCLILAPLPLPPDYSWISHTTSEAAAQALPGAWLARLGFLLFGLAVIWIASSQGRRWGPWGLIAHLTFGVLMVATAVFSHCPIDPELACDQAEDLLHSVSATVMGFAFALGVVSTAVHRRGSSVPRWAFDALAVAASIVIPLSMGTWAEYAGALQRLMFLIAYAWYAAEAIGLRRARQPGA